MSDDLRKRLQRFVNDLGRAWGVPYIAVQRIHTDTAMVDDLAAALLVGTPYPPDQGRTHWEGCWRERGHHNCAVAEIERLAGTPERAPEQPDMRCPDCGRTLTVAIGTGAAWNMRCYRCGKRWTGVPADSEPQPGKAP